MNIHLIKNPTEKDFEPIMDLLNQIFSKYSESNYDATTAYEKTVGKDAVIFQA